MYKALIILNLTVLFCTVMATFLYPPEGLEYSGEDFRKLLEFFRHENETTINFPDSEMNSTELLKNLEQFKSRWPQ